MGFSSDLPHCHCAGNLGVSVLHMLPTCKRVAREQPTSFSEGWTG